MSGQSEDPNEILRKLSEPIYVPDGPLDMPECKFIEGPPSDGDLPEEKVPYWSEPIWKRLQRDNREGPPSNQFPF